MLRLTDITKVYKTGDEEVVALKNVNIEFRESEFVSILGPSGCGKTTLLNIIGGLDQYTSGDLVINGKSTKDFTDHDWDSYRNHSVGFVFQSYNLIPHQTVLSNVELALTLSGVSRAERKKRAADALRKVGLGDQLHKKPNQMSGGQMQRVAIARALVNDPSILLADEPTGALDSVTSTQVMDILKDIAKDRLVIMVTHNPDLAAKYSSRIINLLDGEIVSDSVPYSGKNVVEPVKKKGAKEPGKPSMSFFTALSLSFNNLMTKKARTVLTSFAGSIGIIGIALILSLSNGVQAYINTVEENTLSSYPVTIEKSTVDMTSMMTSFMGSNAETSEHDMDKIYSNNIMGQLITSTLGGITKNDLEAFKKFLESGDTDIKDYCSDIKYGYSTTLNVYKADTSDGVYKVNPSTVFDSIGYSPYDAINGNSAINASEISSSTYAETMNVWRELLSNTELVERQYDVIAGRRPQNYDEVVIVVNDRNEISDYTLYSLGLLDVDDLSEMMKALISGKDYEQTYSSYSYDELLGLEYKLLLNTDYYEKTASGWADRSEDESYIKKMLDSNGTTIKVVGILRPTDDALTQGNTGFIGYLPSLMSKLISDVNDSEIVKAQKSNPDVDIFTGISFNNGDDGDFVLTMDALLAYIDTLEADKAAQAKAYIQSMRESGMTDDAIVEMMKGMYQRPETKATYDGNLTLLGVSDPDVPSTIKLYPKDFESKEKITSIIDDYNNKAGEGGAIKYTDYIGLLLSSVTTIINAISYILIAFVAISLVVSSIMIGIITYISVLERTKEIGILRAIGASKHDISRVFNAETLTIGFAAGVFGIGITLLLTIPINIIIEHLTGIAGLCVLPTAGAFILIAISMVLTFIAGLIPSKIAARKDPVVALRTE